MKILIGEAQFKGTMVSATNTSLNLTILNESDDTFTQLLSLLPTINSTLIKVYGQEGTSEEDVVVSAYQAYCFYNISRGDGSGVDLSNVAFKISPIEVTEADKINQRIKAQSEVIAEQSKTIEEQAATIAKQAEELVEQKKTNTLLTAQVQSVSDRADFVDDCIAEMATIVYA